MQPGCVSILFLYRPFQTHDVQKAKVTHSRWFKPPSLRCGGEQLQWANLSDRHASSHAMSCSLDQCPCSDSKTMLGAPEPETLRPCTVAWPFESNPHWIICLPLLWCPDKMVHIHPPAKGKTISSHILRKMCVLSSSFREYRRSHYFLQKRVCQKIISMSLQHIGKEKAYKAQTFTLILLTFGLLTFSFPFSRRNSWIFCTEIQKILVTWRASTSLSLFSVRDEKWVF